MQMFEYRSNTPVCKNIDRLLQSENDLEYDAK